MCTRITVPATVPMLTDQGIITSSDHFQTGDISSFICSLVSAGGPTRPAPRGGALFFECGALPNERSTPENQLSNAHYHCAQSTRQCR
jgi:hypothetical protein